MLGWRVHSRRGLNVALACAALCAVFAACDDCDEPCDLEAYLSDLAGEGADFCEDAGCAQAALEAGRPMIYHYGENSNFSFAYVYLGEDPPPDPGTVRTAPPQRYFDVSFLNGGSGIRQRTCERLEVVEGSLHGIECVGAWPEYPVGVCDQLRCGLPVQ